MPSGCCVPSCKNRRYDPGITMHTCPTKEGPIREAWLNFSQLTPLEAEGRRRLFFCCAHFLKTDYMDDQSSYLKPSTVPSQNAPRGRLLTEPVPSMAQLQPSPSTGPRITKPMELQPADSALTAAAHSPAEIFIKQEVARPRPRPPTKRRSASPRREGRLRYMKEYNQRRRARLVVLAPDTMERLNKFSLEEGVSPSAAVALLLDRFSSALQEHGQRVRLVHGNVPDKNVPSKAASPATGGGNPLMRKTPNDATLNYAADTAEHAVAFVKKEPDDQEAADESVDGPRSPVNAALVSEPQLLSLASGVDVECCKCRVMCEPRVKRIGVTFRIGWMCHYCGEEIKVWWSMGQAGQTPTMDTV